MEDSDKIQHAKIDHMNYYLLLGMALSLFLFNDTLRTMLIHSEINYKLNLLFMLFAVLTAAYMFYKKNLDLGILLVALTIIGLTFIAIESGSGKMSHYVRATAAIFFPILLLGLRIPEHDFIPFLKSFIKIFNILCIILLVAGIFDYLSDASLQTFFAQQKLFHEELANLVYTEKASGIYRYYSFIGHPLTNALYFMSFYMLNVLYNRYNKPLMNEYLLILIAFTGLLLCGSRTALLAALLMFVFLNNSKHKIAFISFAGVIGAGLFSTAMFKQNLLQRFILKAAAGDVSEGRNLALTCVWKGYVRPPALFTGGGLDSSYLVTKMLGFIKSFEYPFIMLAYDIGILAMALIYLTLFFYPLCVFIKNKHYRLLAFFVLLSIYMNGFNGIAGYNDFMGQFCFLAMILLNLSYLLQKRSKGAVLQ
ncbi:MAG: hypothetical protein ACM3NJ_00610 [Methanobacterium sp.]